MIQSHRSELGYGYSGKRGDEILPEVFDRKPPHPIHAKDGNV